MIRKHGCAVDALIMLSIIYTSTTLVLLSASCSGLFKNGMNSGSIRVRRSMLRSSTWYNAGRFPFVLLTLVMVINLPGVLLINASQRK